MAVVTISLSSLNLETLPKAFSKIGEAINERWTIMKAFGQDPSVSYLDGQWLAQPFCPTLAAKANLLNSMVMKMTAGWVDLSADYVPHSYSNFPKSLQGAAKADSANLGPNSIAVGESFAEETMDKFKNVITNVCNWLNRMTCIQPDNDSCFTMQHWSDSKTWSHLPGYEDTLSNETAPFEPPQERERSFRQESPTITYNRESWQVYFYQDDVIGTDQHTRGLTANTGVIIDNRTPYDAIAKLYLTLPSVAESSWSNKNKWQNLLREIEISREPFNPYPESPSIFYPGGRNDVQEVLVKAGDSWKPYQSIVQDVEYTKDAANYKASGTYDLVKTNYTPDGISSYVMKEEHRVEGPDESVYWHGEPQNEIDVTSEPYNGYGLWEGFGLWNSPSEPMSAECHARTKDYVWEPITALTEPTIDFHAFDGNYTRGNYDWWEQYRFGYSVRIVPILDFTDSITTFAVG